MKKININITRYHWAFIASGIVLILAGVSIYLRAGAMLHAEADAYLICHLSDLPYLSKILSPHLVDAMDYMARPVSHFFDNVDAHLFHFFFLLGIPLFISISTMVMLIILSAVLWSCAIYDVKAHPAIATLMLALLWTNPNVFLAGSLFRDAKIAAAFFFILAGLYAFHIIWLNQQCRFRDFAIIFILAILACLSDPQGLAFVAMLTGIALIWAFFTASRPAYVSFLSGSCASLTYLFLSIVILPTLVAKYTWFNTHSAFVRYQNADGGNLFISCFKYLWDGMLLHLDTIRFLFGNGPRIAIVAGLVFLFIGILKLNKHRVLIGFCFILLLVGNSVIDGAMIARHHALIWPEVMRGGYYQLPSVILFFTAFLFIMPSVCKSFHISKEAFAVLLVIAVFLNIFSLPYHMRGIKGESANIYATGSTMLHARLVHLSNTKPAGPALPYNKVRACLSGSSGNDHLIAQLNIDGKLDTGTYLRTSYVYNYLRSEKGLPYFMPGTGEPLR